MRCVVVVVILCAGWAAAASRRTGREQYNAVYYKPQPEQGYKYEDDYADYRVKESYNEGDVHEDLTTHYGTPTLPHGYQANEHLYNSGYKIPKYAQQLPYDSKYLQYGAHQQLPIQSPLAAPILSYGTPAHYSSSPQAPHPVQYNQYQLSSPHLHSGQHKYQTSYHDAEAIRHLYASPAPHYVTSYKPTTPPHKTIPHSNNILSNLLSVSQSSSSVSLLGHSNHQPIHRVPAPKAQVFSIGHYAPSY